ncbi:MAG: RES family NAD+ phosphorylase [Pseudomonadota bacterium]
MPTPDVPSRIIPAGELLQHVSRSAYRGTALHFGRAGGNRYDDPAFRFGTLDVGFDLSTALMESVFRQHRWSRRAKRVITRTEVYARMVRAIGVLEPLSLADLTAPGVIASQFGLNLSQLASRRYVHTQRIAALVHELADAGGRHRFDGVLYPSRNNHPAPCAALFDRASAKLSLVDDIALRDHVDWPSFLSQYRVVVLPA